MNNPRLDFLFARRPRILYTAPPICDVIFSSSGESAIVFPPFERDHAPTGLVWRSDLNPPRWQWDADPDVICWTIYLADDPNNPFGTYHVVAECNPPVPPSPECPTGNCYIPPECLTPPCGGIIIVPVTPQGPEEPTPPVPQPPWTPECPTIIDITPTQTIYTDTSATLEVHTTGTKPQTFNWFKNDVLIKTETNFNLSSFLTLNPVTEADAGEYCVEVSLDHPLCPDPALACFTLTVLDKCATILDAPGDTPVSFGDNITFFVTTEGSVPQTFRWYHGETLVKTETTSAHVSNYAITNAQEADAGAYHVLVTSDLFPINCADARADWELTVTFCPVVITSPEDQYLDVGDTVNLVVTTSGDTPQTFNWYHGVTLVFSETNSDHASSYTIANAQETDSGEWSVDIISEDCDPTEAVFQVSVGICPVVLTYPPDQELEVGDNVTFTVTTSGDVPQTFNWYRNATLVFTESNSVNQSDFSIPNVQESDAGTYQVEVVFEGDPGCDPAIVFFDVEVEESGECPEVEPATPAAPSGVEPFKVTLPSPVLLWSGDVGPGVVTYGQTSYFACPTEFSQTASIAAVYSAIIPVSVSGFLRMERLSSAELAYTTSSDGQGCYSPSPQSRGADGISTSLLGLIGDSGIYRHQTAGTVQARVGSSAIAPNGAGWITCSVVCHNNTINSITQSDVSLELYIDWQLLPEPAQLELVDGTGLPAALLAAWDLQFPYRSPTGTDDDYDEDNLGWNAQDPGAGAFRGAVVTYTSSHPTSANGCGWRLTIYGDTGSGFEIVWDGYKAIGSAGDGCYYRDSGTSLTPAILQIDEIPE